MTRPTAGDVHVNAPLTNMSVAYLQDQSNFIADRAFPNLPVAKQSDRYYVYDRADFNRDEMTQRAPGTESAGGGYDVDNTPTYFCPVYAYHKDIADQIRANEDTVLNSDRDAMQFVTHKALIKREREFARAALSTGIWGTEELGVTAAPGAGEFLVWNDPNSTPIEQIRTAKRAVLEQTGFEPNKFILGKSCFDALVDHPDIIERIKFGQTPGNPALANASTLAQIFEVQELLVCKAIVNTAQQGIAEASSFISGSNALLAFVAPNPGLMIPSAGYTFSWNGFIGATGMGHRIKKFRLEREASDRVEVEMAFQHKVVGADLGYFFQDAAQF